MLLSTLIAYKDRLAAVRPDGVEIIRRREFGPALHEIESCDIQFHDLTQRLQHDHAMIGETMERFHQTVDQIVTEIDRMISSLQPAYFAESYRLYDEEMSNDSDSHILERRFFLPPAAQDFVSARIRSFGDWHWPAMIIRPGLEDWIQDLVACDPLYLADRNYDIMAPAMDRFNAEYQRRLRRYVIDESQPTMLQDLPRSQFGFVLAYNLFNYKPLEIIRFYLAAVYDCLRSGGTFAFTINDGDRTAGVALAERCFMCYTPAGMIQSLATSLGYSVQQIYHIDSSNTWFEIQKPGGSQSLRGGQALAAVIPKNQQRVDISSQNL